MSLRKSVLFATLHVQEAQRVCLYHFCHLKPMWEVTDLTQQCLAKDHELLLCSKSLSALPGIITCGLLLPKNFAIWNILMEYSHGLVLWQPPDGSTWSIKRKPHMSPICCFLYRGKISSWCIPVPPPRTHRAQGDDTHQDGADFQSKAWPWFPGMCIVPLDGCLILKVFTGRQTPCFYLNRSSCNADFLSRLQHPLQLRRPLWVWAGPRASGGGCADGQTALGSSHSG